MESKVDNDVANQRTVLKCILCQQPCTADDGMDNTSVKKWECLKSKSFQWNKFDKFQHAYATVEWDKGPKGLYMHSKCYTQISSNRHIQQAQKRKRKTEQEQESQASTSSQQLVGHVLKKLRSSTGIVHDRNRCV